MKRMVLLGLCLLALAGCVGPPIPDVVELPNESPIIGFGALHSPNGVQQHAPYEWDVYGTGYDLDGEIVSWIIRIDGDVFRVGNAEIGPYGDGMGESEVIRYQFPQVGWYTFSVTAIDDDGAASTYTPEYTHDPIHNGLWRIEN